MKKWLIGASLAGTVLLSTGSAFASDNLQQQRHHSLHTRTSVEPVDGKIRETDSPSDHRWDVKSSVQVSRETLRDAYRASQNAYTGKLQKYAKCSAKEAEKAIVSEHPGMKVGDVQLRNIRTNLVYIGIVSDEEDRFLVVVDAGNCKVLMDKPLATHHEHVFADEH